MKDEIATEAHHVRWHDLLIAALVGMAYAAVWALLPAEWWPIHVGGKGFLLVFVLTSVLGALLASIALTTPGLRVKDHPAIWLGIQVVFWNPLAFRAVLAAAEAVGLPSSTHAVSVLACLVLIGLPTSLLGMWLSGNGWWRVAYASRAIQCWFATWVPVVPAILFLHVLAIAYLVTWDRYRSLNKLAFLLVLAEQVAAFFWFFLYCRFE